MSKPAAAARSAPAKGKADVRTSSKASGRVAKGRRPATSSKSLHAKEEEYRRMNAELEAKTAELVKEADELVKGNLSLLCDLESSTDIAADPFRSSTSQAGDHSSQHIITSSPVSPPSQQAHTHNDNKPSHERSQRVPATQVVVATDSVRADVDNIVLRAERELDPVEWNQDVHSGIGSNYHESNLLPDTADDMGPEALTRFLKAKLRVMQEEIDRLCQELTDKDKQLHLKEVKVKELTEQNTKLQRKHHAVQPELTKYQKLAESLRQKNKGLESQLTALRKEVEVMKGVERKNRSQHGAVEVRLNRALEEVEKYKTELATLRARSEDCSKAEKVRTDQLTAENKQLVKQRTELMTAFKKQLKLIDILKRQKMHIEAAKLLSFTEEEFVKALDWQTS